MLSSICLLQGSLFLLKKCKHINHADVKDAIGVPACARSWLPLPPPSSRGAGQQRAMSRHSVHSSTSPGRQATPRTITTRSGAAAGAPRLHGSRRNEHGLQLVLTTRRLLCCRRQQGMPFHERCAGTVAHGVHAWHGVLAASCIKECTVSATGQGA